MKAQEDVILLHGLVRSSGSMKKMARAFEELGYTVHNIDYPSTKFTVEDLTARLTKELMPVIESSDRIHFVTHSMGGILVRQILKDRKLPNLGRVVMLSPPNQGSEVVDKLGHMKAFRVLNGPAGAQLGTSEDSLPNKLGPVDFELGIITGDRSINWILSRMIPGPDDGKVSTVRAQIEGMTAFKIVHASHPMIMKKQAVVDMAVTFIQTGEFE